MPTKKSKKAKKTVHGPGRSLTAEEQNAMLLAQAARDLKVLLKDYRDVPELKEFVEAANRFLETHEQG